MDEETRKKIFEPFFTIDSSGEKKGSGLSVVYGIVKQHGGFIDMLSEKGAGAIFLVHLPLATERIKTDKILDDGAIGGQRNYIDCGG